MLDTDVAGCHERMIVVSDNACAEKFIDGFGATNLNNFLYGNSISRLTTFTSSDASKTTAADLEKLLIGIENGSKVSGSDRSRLLDAMGRQKYRAGIPAGSSGKVEDKVGFLWDYLHDAAIVRHPKGTYAAVIMTKGASWGRIAEITKELERIMYP
jgi:beta-lactamase class A